MKIELKRDIGEEIMIKLRELDEKINKFLNKNEKKYKNPSLDGN